MQIDEYRACAFVQPQCHQRLLAATYWSHVFCAYWQPRYMSYVDLLLFSCPLYYYRQIRWELARCR